MGVDTGIIFNIGNKGVNQPVEQLLRENGIDLPPIAEKPLKPPKNRLQFEADRRQAERKRYFEGIREYQANIRRSKCLRAEILTGIRDGADMETLLLKATECIAKMTGDETYYKNAVEHLQRRK